MPVKHVRDVNYDSHSEWWDLTDSEKQTIIAAIDDLNIPIGINSDDIELTQIIDADAPLGNTLTITIHANVQRVPDALINTIQGAVFDADIAHRITDTTITTDEHGNTFTETHSGRAHDYEATIHVSGDWVARDTVKH